MFAYVCILAFGDSSFPNIPRDLPMAQPMARGAEIEIAIEKASKNPNTESQEFLGATKQGAQKTGGQKHLLGDSANGCI